MKRTALGLLVGLLLLPAIAFAVPTLVFDTTPGGAGGTMTYAGTGGPLVADDIVFVEIAGQDTPLNNGVTLACVGCSLNFVTGDNLQEGPGQLWTWAGGGSFTLTGSVPALGLVDVPLISGSFTGTDNTPGLAGSGTSALFVSVGIDVKDPTLAGFYGLSPTGFNFANTEIALDTFNLGADGAFVAVPNQADIINTQAPDGIVPNPATALLLGLGLVLAGTVRRMGRLAA